jgi:hypothetical protein
MTNDKKLSELVQMDSPDAVLDEVIYILQLISPEFNIDLVKAAFTTVVSLYNGKYPGYQACNTEYHNILHITDTFLAMARMIHGAINRGQTFSERNVDVALVAVLFHDTGYIQEEHDIEGTGAKHTIRHVQRSMDFLERHGFDHGLSEEEIIAGRALILCTDLYRDLSKIKFPSSSVEILGKMLGAADLLAQMADRTYLEKLMFLYQEFREGEVEGFENEEDLLRKTVSFYDFINQRLETQLGAADRFMRSHFVSRWNIDADLYHVAIEKQKEYLEKILQIPGSNPMDHLRRCGIVECVRARAKKARPA